MAHHKSAQKRIRQTRSRKLYNRQNKKQIKEAESHTIHYGFIYDNDTMIDEVLVMIMKGHFARDLFMQMSAGTELKYDRQGKVYYREAAAIMIVEPHKARRYV